MPALCYEPLKLMAALAGRRVVAHLAPGDCVGEAALLAEGGTRSASIQAERLVQVSTSQLLSRLLCCSPLGRPICPMCPHRYCCLARVVAIAVSEAFMAAPVLLSILGSWSRQTAAVAAQQSGCVVAIRFLQKFKLLCNSFLQSPSCPADCCDAPCHFRCHGQVDGWQSAVSRRLPCEVGQLDRLADLCALQSPLPCLRL